MAERRIVVEHKDGRRVGVMEADFDRAEANPFNHGRTVREDSGRVYQEPARPTDDHVSLKAEGFKAVAMIDDDGHEVGLKD